MAQVNNMENNLNQSLFPSWNINCKSFRGHAAAASTAKSCMYNSFIVYAHVVHCTHLYSRYYGSFVHRCYIAYSMHALSADAFICQSSDIQSTMRQWSLQWDVKGSVYYLICEDRWLFTKKKNTIGPYCILRKDKVCVAWKSVRFCPKTVRFCK